MTRRNAEMVTGIRRDQREIRAPRTWPAPLQPLKPVFIPIYTFIRPRTPDQKSRSMAIGPSQTDAAPSSHAKIAASIPPGAIDPIGIGRAILTNIQSGETSRRRQHHQPASRKMSSCPRPDLRPKSAEFVMAFLLNNCSKDKFGDLPQYGVFWRQCMGIDVPPGPPRRRRKDKTWLKRPCWPAWYRLRPIIILQNYPAAKA